MAKLYDTIILGGGPGGLSVALALGRVHRSCIVISNSIFRNDGAEASHSVLGLDHIPPAQIRSTGIAQIGRYQNTTFAQANITKVSRVLVEGPVERQGFEIAEDGDRQWRGRTLVLATGVQDVFPDLKGYAENWPANIYQCPFCDGHERAALPMGVLAYPKFEPFHVMMGTILHNLSLMPGEAAEVAGVNADQGIILKRSPVTIFTNGPANPDNDQAIATALSNAKAFGMAIDERPVTALVPSNSDKVPTSQRREKGLYVQFDADSSNAAYCGFVLHKPYTKLRARTIIDQLGLEIKPAMYGGECAAIKTPSNGTNIPGVFVAGDTGNEITQVSGAMFTGVIAAGGVAHELAQWDTDVAKALQKFQREV